MLPFNFLSEYKRVTIRSGSLFKVLVRPISILPIIIALFPLIGLSQSEDAARAKKIFDEAEILFAIKTPAARKDAITKYVEAFSASESAKDETGEAAALNRLVELMYLDSEFSKAISYAEKALIIYRRLNNRASEAEMLNDIAAFLDFQGQSRKALPVALQSIAILREIGDKKNEAGALNTLGSVYDSLGEVEKSLEAFNQSLLLRRETGDKTGEANTLANLATAYQATSNYGRSFEKFEQAINIFREVNDTRTEAIVLNNYGISLKNIGEYQKALDIFAQSLELRRQNADKRGEAITLSNMADVHKSLNDYPQSLALLEQSLPILQAAKLRNNEAITLSGMAAIYNLLNNNQKALEFYEKSLTIRHELDNKSGEALVISGIGKIYLEEGNAAKSLEYFNSALNLALQTQNKERIAGIYLRIGRADESLEKLDAAAENYQKALDLNREIGLREAITECLYYLARIRAAKGKQTSALELIRETVNLNETLRRNVTSEDLRADFLADNLKYYEFYIDLLMKSHRLEPNKEFAEQALQISETMRARNLLESLGATRSEIRADALPQTINAEQSLIQRINAKELQRINALRQNQPENAKNLENEISELVNQHRDVEAKIRQQSPKFAALTQINLPALKEIQTSLLDENTILLEYSLGAESSYLFFISKNDFKVFNLPKEADIEKQGRKFYAGLRERGLNPPNETLAKRRERLELSDNAVENTAAVLSEMLLKPILPAIKNKRLLIAASGILQYIPFAALPVSPRQINKNQNLKNQFLIETNEIVYLSSAAALAALRKSSDQQKSNSIAVIADPVFSQDDLRVKAIAKQNLTNQPKNNLSILRGDLGRLRFSRREAEMISNLISEDKRFVALDFNASVLTVKNSNFKRGNILHFATHAFVRSDFPELSGMVLSLVDENGKEQNGFLRLFEIYNLDLNSDLVVLSACETALGKDIKGEGLIGLTHGFLTAGSRRVVASLWRVDDKATAELMRHFYQKMLKENQRPADALRQAQISLIRNENFKNPYYWAAFTLQGEYR